MNTKRISTTALAIALGSLLSACTSGNSAVQPTVRGVDPIATTTLQLAVGTANIAGTTGLNTVATFRQQSNGASGSLVNSPALTGPAGFVVPASPAFFADAGTASFTSQPQAILGAPQTPPVSTTFGYSGGVFGMSFAPANATALGTPTYPTRTGGNYYKLPLGGAAPLSYIGGPPAFPQVRDGTYPPNYGGFLEGFTDFAATPVAGTYTLNVSVPTSATTNGTKTATATLANVVPLPTFAAPTIALDGTGGGTISLTVPAGVTEAYVDVVDTTGSCYGLPAPAFFTIRTTTVGPQTLTLPDTLGPPVVTATSSTPVRTICSGDKYQVYAVGFDYPAFAASYPNSTSAAPALIGAAGQADITTSAVTAGTSP